MAFEVVLLSFSVVTMAGVLVIGALLFKARKDKMMKAASPPLLYLSLIGSFVLYSEAVIGWFPASRVTCMARPWIRHVGFSITYGALLIKTWRISAIMRMVKAKVVPTKDAQLFRAVAILVLVSSSYMLVWTLADPVQPKQLPRQPERPNEGVTEVMWTSVDLICILPWWDFIISLGEFCFILWGGTLCYQARKAPDIYNETRPISYALWNEALWGIFYIYASCLLSIHPAVNMNYLLCFLRVQCTVTVTLLLLFVPKFRAVYSTLRELRGTVADVYGAKRIHRLSLMLSKNGAIQTIYCVPCGPLTYAEAPDEDTPDSVSETGDNNKENHYTKAEVDALIEMVSRLKNEKTLYKTQVKRLYHLLKEYKHRLPINSLPVYLVAETPEREELPNDNLLPEDPTNQKTPSGGALWQDMSSTSAYSSTKTLPNDSPDTRSDSTTHAYDETEVSRLGETNYACALMTHSRKASTVTTYLSSASENNIWTGDDMAEEDLLSYAKSGDVSARSTPNYMTSPVSDYSSYHDSLPNAHDDTIAATENSAANRTDLTLDLYADDIRTPQTPSGDDPDDYPRLVNADGIDPDCPRDIQDFISTICGKVKDKGKPAKTRENESREENDVNKQHEMDTLKNGKSNNLLTNAVKLSAKAFDRRRKGARKSSDKMSFVMYI